MLLISVENNMLKEVMDSLASTDIEYIFDQTMKIMLKTYIN